VLPRGLEKRPELTGLQDNLACFAAHAGNTEEAFAHLALAIEDSPGLREFARADPDFDGVRDEPRFLELVGEE